MGHREIALFEHAGSHYLLIVDAESHAPSPTLTSAEEEILALVAAGLSNDEIAVARGTKRRTITNQLGTLCGKLGVGSRAELSNARAQLGRAGGQRR